MLWSIADRVALNLSWVIGVAFGIKVVATIVALTTGEGVIFFSWKV